MSKYTKDDPDVAGLEDLDRANYENYLLNYDVDANIETAKGSDALTSIKNVLRGGTLKVELQNPQGVYLILSTMLIGIAVVFVVMLVLFFLFKIVVWFFKKDDVSKLHWQISLLLIIFLIGLIVLVIILTKIKDAVQILLEKIVYKL